MVRKYIPLFFICMVCLPIFGQNSESKLIELPLTHHDGYGRFQGGLFLIHFSPEKLEDASWTVPHKILKGVPADWKEVKKGMITIDMFQEYYQDYHSGYLSTEFYERVKQKRHWPADSTHLSKTPIKCTVGVAVGTDATGQKKVVIDQNNNGDFSDDTPCTLTRMPGFEIVNEQLTEIAVPVTFERLQGGKIIQMRTLVAVVELDNGWCAYNLPQYATAECEGQLIGIYGRFRFLDYGDTCLALLNEGDTSTIAWNEVFDINEYIKIHDTYYKNLGVDISKNVLRLQAAEVPASQLYSTQVGFRAIGFSGNDYQTQAKLSLEGCQGKYVFVHFWSSTCGSCLKEFPELKELYATADKSKVEIIGIVDEPSNRAVDRILEKYGVNWPQIQSYGAGSITSRYGLNAFPATFLIDPDGVILVRDLRGKDVESRFKELNLLK